MTRGVASVGVTGGVARGVARGGWRHGHKTVVRKDNAYEANLLDLWGTRVNNPWSLSCDHGLRDYGDELM